MAGLETIHQVVVQSIVQGILFVDLQGSILLLNPAGERLLNKSLDVVGQRFWKIFADDTFGFSLREALRFGLSHRLLYKTIETKEYEISTIFVFEGGIPGLLILMRDITELGRMQRTLHHQDRMKELGEMAASVAHEIRNPLGGIRGYAALLMRDLSGQKTLQEMASAIQDGTKRLESLMTALLLYARPVKLQLQSVELGSFLKQLGSFVRVDPAYPAHVRLEIHIPQDPILVPVDPAALKSCLLNLIYNAFQAMPQGGTLILSLLKLDSLCQIAVSDTGIGIDEQHLGDLFSPFFTTKLKGTGLGLVEARKIAKAHGGSLEVRSSSGRGATFTLAIPLKRGTG